MKDKKPWGFCETPDEGCTMNYCDENGCQNRKRHLTPDKEEIYYECEICDKKMNENQWNYFADADGELHPCCNECYEEIKKQD